MLEKAPEDPDAFREIYEHFFPRIYAYVSYRVASSQDAEDLVSDTFFKVLNRLETFQWRGDGSFSAWLFRITNNVVADYYRRMGRTETEVFLDELPEILEDTSYPCEGHMQKEEFIYLRQLIERLSQRRQEVIRLKFFGGLRNNEIAQVLGLDERTVASHLCRALEDLHRLYILEFGKPKKEGSYE